MRAAVPIYLHGMLKLPYLVGIFSTEMAGK
jgi:hypothetical protein